MSIGLITFNNDNGYSTERIIANAVSDEDCLTIGSTGHNDLIGDAGQDTLLGGAGTDDLFGGADNDTLDGSADSDCHYVDAQDINTSTYAEYCVTPSKQKQRLAKRWKSV